MSKKEEKKKAHSNGYYATDGGLDYETFQKHFEKQSEGKITSMMMNNATSLTTLKKMTNTGRGRLVLISMTGKDKDIQAQGQNVGKLEVIDPTEAARRRAVDAAKEESVKYNDFEDENHSSQGGQKRHKSPQSKGGRKKVKATDNRARDIFDD